MPFDVLPSKRRITLPWAGQINEIVDAGAIDGTPGAGESLSAGLDDATFAFPVDAIAVPAGGDTRSTWPTSMASGLLKLFHRTMFDTDVRLAFATRDSVSPFSTR